MKVLRLTIGLVCFFFLFNTLGFAQGIFKKDDYRRMPELFPNPQRFAPEMDCTPTGPIHSKDLNGDGIPDFWYYTGPETGPEKKSPIGGGLIIDREPKPNYITLLPPGWEDWTPQQRADWLKQEVLSGDSSRVNNAITIFGSLNAKDQAAILTSLFTIRFYFNPITNFLPNRSREVAIKLFQSLNHDQQLGVLTELLNTDVIALDAISSIGYLRPNPARIAAILLQSLGADSRNKLFVDLAKQDVVAAAKILLNWSGGYLLIMIPDIIGQPPQGGAVSADVAAMFKALLEADPAKAGAVLGELLKNEKMGTLMAGAIFRNLSTEDQAKIINNLIPAHNPDPNSEGYKVMNKLFQALSYGKQLALLKVLSKDNYYPTAAVHILQNLDATVRNKLFVDLAKVDALAASRIIAHWPTGVNAPEIYEMFGEVLKADKNVANAILAALDADPVRAYFADALREHFGLDNPNPDDGGWWDGMTVEQIISTLQGLIDDKKLDEAGQKFSELAGADLDLAAQAMQGMKTATAAKIVNQLEVGLAADVLEKMDAKKVAEILTAREVVLIALPMPGIYPTPRPIMPAIGPIISADKAGQILAAMDKEKAADVLEAIKPFSAVPIVRAMLKNQGVQAVADIMKLMDPAKVAAIMAVPNWRPWPIWGNARILPRTIGLTVKECADILKAMGGLKDKEARKILWKLFSLNPYKAIRVYFELIGKPFPLPRPYSGVVGGPRRR